MAASVVLATVSQVSAQGAAPPAAKPEMTESCPGLVAERMPFAQPAAFRLAALEHDQVRISYIGHATFLIESPQLVRIATDYNDYVRPPVTPDIVTINHAHTTHFTDHPDPAIKHVLRGWREDEKPARIDLHLQGCARAQRANQYPHLGTAAPSGTAIRFSFSTVANLCIAHLGHLHHTLNQQQLNEIGRIDVVLVPVDGNLHARSRRHGRGAARAECAADDPDALFQRLYAQPLPGSRAAGMGRGDCPRCPRQWCRRRPCRISRRSWCCPDIDARPYLPSLFRPVTPSKITIYGTKALLPAFMEREFAGLSRIFQMMQTWSGWKRFSDGRTDTIEAPAGPGVYEVRHTLTGRVMAFGHSSHVAKTIAELTDNGETSPWARLLGRQPLTDARFRPRIPHLCSGELRRRQDRRAAAAGTAAERLAPAHGIGLDWPSRGLTVTGEEKTAAGVSRPFHFRAVASGQARSPYRVPPSQWVNTHALRL